MEKRIYGPQLPSVEKQPATEDRIVGPSLPDHLKKSETDSTKNDILLDQISDESDSKELCNTAPNVQDIAFGPQLPPHLKSNPITPEERDESDEDIPYGPLPPGASGTSSAYDALEERALQLKINRLIPEEEKGPVRESWMLELPDVKTAAHLGLGPRQFRNREAPDLTNRSSWTTVGGKKETKAASELDIKAEAELRELQRRDKEQEKISKKHKRKEKSLLDAHQKKLKLQKQNEESTERKPFSRETDLQVNKFDEAQKKAILKKAQLLDNRFSSGKSKYL